MISSVKSKLVTIAAMTSLSPSSTSLSSSGSASPTPSSSSSGLSSIGVGSLPTADIRITYDSDEGSALNRPEMIGIRSDRLIDREPISSSPLSSMSSPSDCLSSNTSLNSPISNFGGSCSPKPATNLTIQGLILDQTRLSISRASSMDEGIFPSPLNSPARSTPSSPIGPKFKIIHEGDIHLCRLNHQRTVISKILSSKFLRRWETHRLYLTSVNIASKTIFTGNSLIDCSNNKHMLVALYSLKAMESICIGECIQNSVLPNNNNNNNDDDDNDEDDRNSCNQTTAGAIQIHCNDRE